MIVVERYLQIYLLLRYYQNKMKVSILNKGKAVESQLEHTLFGKLTDHSYIGETFQCEKVVPTV